MGLSFSVVIPTHDRLTSLREVLAAVEAQRGAPEFEIIVVDDGSTDGTREWLATHAFSVPAAVLRQEKSGPAAARNAGIAAARGERIAFLGDDTVPEPSWLAEHARAHRERGNSPMLAILGRTRWHRRMRVTPFLDYLNEGGQQFGYGLIRGGEEVPFNFFYTSIFSSRSRSTSAFRSPSGKTPSAATVCTGAGCASSTSLPPSSSTITRPTSRASPLARNAPARPPSSSSNSIPSWARRSALDRKDRRLCRRRRGTAPGCRWRA
jgi:hypothetical protein